MLSERERERERDRQTDGRTEKWVEVHEVHISSLLNPVALSVLAPEVYYDCEMYPAGTTYQKIDKTRRECIMENVDGADRLFCKHWQCETPQCAEEDQVTWPDGCNACPGSYIL